MPTGEVRLTDAPAEEVGGFGAMLEMMNLSRLYNAVASVAVIGRAIHEARYYIERRIAFGRPVIEHPLARETLLDLEAEHLAALLMTFETVDALQRSDDGDDEAARLQRALVPIVKAVTGKLAVPCVSEAMELIGGNAYIEESPLPAPAARRAGASDLGRDDQHHGARRVTRRAQGRRPRDSAFSHPAATTARSR